MPYKDEQKRKDYSSQHYQANKESVYQRSKAAKESRRRFVNAVKSFPCQDCGVSWPPCAMEFDHLDGFEKIASVSHLVKSASLKRIIEEIMKCDLVCACCHALRTTDC